MYKDKTTWNKAFLNVKLQSITFIAEHTSEFQSLVNKLSTVELQLEDKEHVLLLFSYLLDISETLVVTLINLAPNEKLTMSIVKDALFNEEVRRKDASNNQLHTFVMENRERQ